MLSLFGFISSILFSSPLFAFTEIESMFTDASYCYEEWPKHLSKIAYVYTCLMVQHILPSIFIIVAYFRIYKTFETSSKRTEMFSAKVFFIPNIQNVQCFSFQDYRKMNRRRRTNIILSIICIVFFVTWAPLNILNVIINTKNPFQVSVYQVANKNVILIQRVRKQAFFQVFLLRDF